MLMLDMDWIHRGLHWIGLGWIAVNYDLLF